jgi:hypothetical protein
MHEQEKVNEAKYFYSRMLSEIDNRENFLFNLSAFLSSARSVLQYALKEARTRSGGQQWYDGHINASPTLSFFKDKRDINIHTQPIDIRQNINIEITDRLYISDSVSIRVTDKDGKVVSEHTSEPAPPPPREADIPPKVSNQFTFPDWPGPEDVPGLCRLYLDELVRIVADGQAKGFLTNPP